MEKKKISSQTKKEMENFIPASLKRHFFFRKLNYIRKYNYVSFWDKGLYIKWRIIYSLYSPDVQ